METVYALIIFQLQTFSLFKQNSLQPNCNLNSPKLFLCQCGHNSYNLYKKCLVCTNFNFGFVFLRTNNSIRIYVNLFLCLEFYSKISIDRSGYFVYSNNSNRPTSRLLDSGFGLIDLFSDCMENIVKDDKLHQLHRSTLQMIINLANICCTLTKSQTFLAIMIHVIILWHSIQNTGY